MEFPIFYNKMHIDVEDMNSFVDDIENLQITHIKDFHSGAQGAVLTTTYGSSAQITFEDIISPSLTINVSGGISYSTQYHRINTRTSIIGETQTSSASGTVYTTNPVVSVDGVFTSEGGSGVNYFTGGSFNSTTKEITLGTGLPSHPQTVYINYYRMPEYTITEPPTGASGTHITRIDLLYLEYNQEETEPRSIDFISSNRQIYQEVDYTRKIDGFEIKTLKGTQVSSPTVATAPSNPDADIVPLAYIHLRNNTTAIYNSDTGAVGSGYIEDIRNTV